MVCKFVLLPLLAGLALSAPSAYAKNAKALKAGNLTSKSLSFVENKGQIVNQNQEPRPDIDFRLSTGKGLSVFIGDGQVHYQFVALRRAQGDNTSPEATDGIGSLEDHDTSRPSYKMYRMDVELIGANRDAEVITESRQQFHERYFQPWINKSNSNEGVVAHSYRKITYQNVYPNIDWVLYVKGNTVEYDFVVRPGGKVSDIKMKYRGATELNINTDGSLSAKTPMGEITEQAPYSFQQDGEIVASRFVLKGDVLSFSTGDYSGILTIDPTLEWATYFGDLGEDIAYGLTTDSSNNVYMTGVSSSISNIATTGSFQDTIAGNTDAFIAKFNALGDCLWASYFGGAVEDRATGICMAPASSFIYLSGVTKSTAGVASAGAFQDLPGGDYDALLAKFDTSGQRIWATYYGGSGSDGGGLVAGVACDGEGNAFLCAETMSDNNISTTSSYQASRGGAIDAFIAKFDSSGQRLWGSYLGGTGNEFGRKMGCDSLGNIYLGGYTSSSSGIATSGAYQSSFGGVFDAFLSKFNPSGGLEWATYFGGLAIEIFNAIDVRPDGTSYIGGITGSNAGIATAGVHQDTLGGIVDGLLAAFATNGQLQWGTYLGGNSLDVINAISTNEHAVYASGGTSSIGGISTPGSFQDTLNNGDAFIVSFNLSGQRDWGTYFGGADADIINASFITNTEQFYFAGQTISATNIATPGGYQPNFGGGSNDAFLAQFNVCETPQTPDHIIGDTLLCSGHEYTFSVDSVTGASSYNWALPNGWMGNSDSTSIIIVPDASNGSISVAANNSCATSDSVILGITVHASPEPEIENNNNVLSTTLPYASYQWNLDGQAINGATAATYIVTVNGSYSVTVSNANGCSATSDTIDLDGVGVADLQLLREAISIYPNPTENMVFIQSPVRVDVEVVSIEGRILWNVKKAKAISLKETAAGMYLLHVYDQVGRLVKVVKVVKQ